ncbi:MAG: tRNA pseudouridine synthase A [Ferruginibacter sp.]
MPRYFIEVAYNGKAYAGFQKQHNANTIQAEVEKALHIYYRSPFELTGSSRTDAGVHARQNFFHFDTELGEEAMQKGGYHLNAILPDDIVVRSIRKVGEDAHARFDAVFRRYEYHIYQQKDPFKQEFAYFFPYRLNRDILSECAAELLRHTDFEAFSKRNSQVFTYNCVISRSEWVFNGDELVYIVEANRFLRGMVKGLVGTMLKTATKTRSLEDFRAIILSKDCSRADFSVESKGLSLVEVGFPG